MLSDDLSCKVLASTMIFPRQHGMPPPPKASVGPHTLPSASVRTKLKRKPPSSAELAYRRFQASTKRALGEHK